MPGFNQTEEGRASEGKRFRGLGGYDLLIDHLDTGGASLSSGGDSLMSNNSS